MMMMIILRLGVLVIISSAPAVLSTKSSLQHNVVGNFMRDKALQETMDEVE